MLMSLAVLAAATLALGVCLGVSGYGGFLVPPLLVWLAGFDDPSRAVAHALIAAAAPSLLGAALYRRHHRTPRLLPTAPGGHRPLRPTAPDPSRAALSTRDPAAASPLQRWARGCSAASPASWSASGVHSSRRRCCCPAGSR